MGVVWGIGTELGNLTVEIWTELGVFLVLTCKQGSIDPPGVRRLINGRYAPNPTRTPLRCFLANRGDIDSAAQGSRITPS